MEKILDFALLRERKVEQRAEEIRYYFVKKTSQLKNSFNKDFYCLCAEFAYIDAVNCFAELDCAGNAFYENLETMTDVSWKRFFKILAIYNTLKICIRRKKDLKCEDMQSDMFFVFEFDETEEKFFNILRQMAFSFETRFNAFFPQIMIKYVMGKTYSDACTIAFTENFCYNSYSNLMKYFSRYISVSRRIILSKQA